MWKVSLLLLCVLCLARADDSSSSSSSSSSEENKNKALDVHFGKHDGNAATEVEDTPPLMLTPYVHSKDIGKARELARVSIGNVVSYSGYLTVDFEKHCDRHLFFWFFPAEKDWEDAPVILWLQGRPGHSSMFGLFEEIGPFNSFADGLHLRETSWTKFANVIVIDNPAGAGFSFATKGCEPKSISTVVEDLHEAVEQIVKLFPELDDNGLFLAGESFAGHYIPPLGELIDKKNTKKEQIKLKGVVMGNPFLNIECHDYATFLYQTGLIDDNLRDEIEKVQKKMNEHVKEKKYLKAFEDWNFIRSELIGKKAGLTTLFSILSQPEDKSTYIQLLQDQEVKNLIHAGTQGFVDFNVTTFKDLAATIPESYVPELGKLLKTKKYIVAIYSGNLDIASMSTSSECVMRDLKWSGQNEYLKASRKIWYMDNEVVGWTKNVDNLLLDVLVKDASFYAILDQPEVTYKMMESIVTAKPGQDPLRALNTK